jgi:hypothetical protein
MTRDPLQDALVQASILRPASRWPLPRSICAVPTTAAA